MSVINTKGAYGRKYKDEKLALEHYSQNMDFIIISAFGCAGALCGQYISKTDFEHYAPENCALQVKTECGYKEIARK